METSGFNPKREARPSQTRKNGRCSKNIIMSFNPKREARPSQTPTRKEDRTALLCGFNPKREARPSQTPTRKEDRTALLCGFNPKREARPSQTFVSHIMPLFSTDVSIPNGKPGPLRRNRGERASRVVIVSIPNGKPGPLRPLPPLPGCPPAG